MHPSHSPVYILFRQFNNLFMLPLLFALSYQVWDNFFEACEGSGKELLRDGAIDKLDIEEWQSSKSKIVNIGIPAYAFLGCLIQSIHSGSAGFVMRMNLS